MYERGDFFVKTIYKPDEYEMKLIILYVIQNLKISATYTILDYIISSTVDLNYFDLQNHIDNLIETDNIAELEIDDEKVYSITVPGEETIGFFRDRIPFSIREKLDAHIKEYINEKENSASEITSDYYPVNEDEYAVNLTIKENGVTMLNLEIYIGDKETAKNTPYTKELISLLKWFFYKNVHLLLNNNIYRIINT